MTQLGLLEGRCFREGFDFALNTSTYRKYEEQRGCECSRPSGLYVHGCVELGPGRAANEQPSWRSKHVWKRVEKVTSLKQDGTWLNP